MSVHRLSQPLRGGAWFIRPGSARATFRLWYKPSKRLDFNGFLYVVIVWRRR